MPLIKKALFYFLSLGVAAYAAIGYGITPLGSLVHPGMKEGFVKMSAYGPSVSAKAKEAGDKARMALTKGDFVIFKGPIKDNKGNVVVPAGTGLEMTNLELEKMGWLVEGVIGSIPA